MSVKEPLLLNESIVDRESILFDSNPSLLRRRRKATISKNEEFQDETTKYHETHETEDLDAAISNSTSGGLSWCNNGAVAWL
mmetsp:Transcript_1366/g.2366  ORF Transcript_1366/g.2366 Transcript_1366/m.2366 type:complete len:82 (+) Transcript_1366:32-277(+)